MKTNDIWMVYGFSPREMARQLAASAGLARRIGRRDSRIGLKPNLVVARPADGGATTHVEIVEGLVDYLQGKGFCNITLLEGAWVGDDTEAAFTACGYRPLEQRGVRLLNTQRDTATPHDCAGLCIELCDCLADIDFLINLPVLKGHCQTGITCALKNMKGVIPDREKRRFHAMGLHKPIAHLNTGLRQDFILVDGICGDLDFEEGGNPVPAGRMYACCDPVLCDAFAARLLGYELEEVPYIRLAEALGVGSANLEAATLHELNRAGRGAGTRSGRKTQKFSQKIREKSACSACYAALVRALSRLDGAALARIPEGGICIGQGMRGKQGTVGVGSCALGCDTGVPGCPPPAADIRKMLEKIYG